MVTRKLLDVTSRVQFTLYCSFMGHTEKVTIIKIMDCRVITDKLFIDVWEGGSRERLWCNLSYFSGNCVEGLRKIT